MIIFVVFLSNFRVSATFCLLICFEVFSSAQALSHQLFMSLQEIDRNLVMFVVQIKVPQYPSGEIRKNNCVFLLCCYFISVLFGFGVSVFFFLRINSINLKNLNFIPLLSQCLVSLYL